jgi:hypothetical protein
VSLRSFRISVALGALAVPAAVAMSSPAVATSAASSAASATVVSLRDPVGLPLGAPPAAAYITGVRGGPIYRPGQAPLHVGADKGYQSQLVRARGGYLVTQGASHVRFVSDTGSSHEVFTLRGHSTLGIRDVVTSHDGRFVAVMVRAGGFDSDRDVHLVICRIAQPKTIARRTFHIPVTVASLTGRRALLTPGGDAMVRNVRHAPTRWWTLRTNRLRTIDTSGRISRQSDYGGLSAADLSAGQVSLVRGDHNRVVPLHSGSARSWNTNAHEWVVSWSPDDRYVLTSGWTPEKPRDGNGWDVLSVRRARDGRLITEFTGYQNLSASSMSLTWQDSKTLLVDAWDTCDHGSCANVHNLRCSLHGPCEQVEISGTPVGFDSVEQSRSRSS